MKLTIQPSHQTWTTDSVTLPLGSTSLPFLTPISLVGTTNAKGAILGYSCGIQICIGIWYFAPRNVMGKVPCKRTRRAACPLSNAIYQHAPQVLEEDELNASVLTDSVRRCIKISITSARIRSRAGYGLRTFFSQSLVRSIDEDMAVREGLSVSESSDWYRG